MKGIPHAHRVDNKAEVNGAILLVTYRAMWISCLYAFYPFLWWSFHHRFSFAPKRVLVLPPLALYRCLLVEVNHTFWWGSTMRAFWWRSTILACRAPCAVCRVPRANLVEALLFCRLGSRVPCRGSGGGGPYGGLRRATAAARADETNRQLRPGSSERQLNTRKISLGAGGHTCRQRFLDCLAFAGVAKAVSLGSAWLLRV